MTPKLREIEHATQRFDPADDHTKLPLKYWADLGNITPPDKLIRRLLGTSSFVVLYGETGCGKTFLATFLGLHIALGWPCFGRAVERGAVLYIAAEGASGINNRIAAFRLATSTPDDVPFVVIPKPIDIGPNGPDVDAVIKAVQEVERKTGLTVVCIVLDTLARTIGAGDENLAHDMGAYIARCDKVKAETGATLIVIHHTGKATGNGPRGSSALKAAADTQIWVEKRGDVRVATVQKQKDGAEGEELTFRLQVTEIGRDDDGEPIRSCIVVPSDAPAPAARCREPSGQSGLVLRALQKAIADSGEPAPAGNHIPADARVVPVERWRQYAYQMMGSVTPDGRQKAFKRAQTSLANTGHIGAWGAVAWLTS